MIKLCVWFCCEVVTAWFIWASFMAIKFMIEVAQHQKASFSISTNAVGAFIMIPILLTIVASIGLALFAADGDFD